MVGWTAVIFGSIPIILYRYFMSRLAGPVGLCRMFLKSLPGGAWGFREGKGGANRERKGRGVVFIIFIKKKKNRKNESDISITKKRRNGAGLVVSEGEGEWYWSPVRAGISGQEIRKDL